MSVQNEIDRISGNVSDTMSALSEYGVDTTGANSDDMAGMVRAIPKATIVQGTGNNETAVMSQKAVTTEMNKLSSEKVDQHGVEQTVKNMLYDMEQYTNLVPLATNTVGAIYNGSGFLNGYRLNSSGEIVETSYACITGFIPWVAGDTLRMAGTRNPANSGGNYVGIYNAAFELIGVYTISSLIPADGSSLTEDNFYRFVLPTSGAAFQGAAYIRVSLNYCEGADLVVTANEEI